MNNRKFLKIIMLKIQASIKIKIALAGKEHLGGKISP